MRGTLSAAARRPTSQWSWIRPRCPLEEARRLGMLRQDLQPSPVTIRSGTGSSSMSITQRQDDHHDRPFEHHYPGAAAFSSSCCVTALVQPEGHDGPAPGPRLPSTSTQSKSSSLIARGLPLSDVEDLVRAVCPALRRALMLTGRAHCNDVPATRGPPAQAAAHPATAWRAIEPEQRCHSSSTRIR